MFAFAAWIHSAGLTIKGTAWTPRYVLLCKWGESATTKLTVNVSIKTRFRSKTPSESSCRQSRPDRSSSASRGCVHVPAYHSKWVNFGSFAKACHDKFFYSGFLFFLEQQGAHEYYSLTKKSGVYLQPAAIDKEPKSNTKIYVNQNGVTGWHKLESTYFVTSISARNTGRWAFF